MEISKIHAQQIVEEMEILIKKNVNIMNSEGYVIASTDFKRIDQFHGGAFKIIKEKLDLLVIDSPEQYVGARPGINLPIVINDEIVGVIGITGKKEKVLGYGEIIKKMTEISLMEFYVREQLELKKRAQNFFIERWIFGENSNDESDFEMRASVLGLKINNPKICVVMQIESHDFEKENEVEIQKMRDEVLVELRNKFKSSSGCYVISIAAYYVLLLSFKSPAEAKEKLLPMKTFVENQWKIKMSVGIGNSFKSYYEANRSFLEAEKALRLSKDKMTKISLYEEVSMELLIEEIPARVKKDFVNKIFNQCSEVEIKEWIKILKLFFKNNSSINVTATELFIHKNTLQYKLKKIYKKTGYDPRVTKDALLLNMAVLILSSTVMTA